MDDRKPLELEEERLAAEKNYQSPWFINRFTKTHKIIELWNFEKFSLIDLKERNEKVKIAGRIMKIRNFGKLIFAEIEDQSASIQLMDEDEHFLNLGVGDIVGVSGIITKTKKEQLTLKATKLELLSKCVKNLPNKYYGLKDIEERFRKRYLDFILNPEKREIFRIRNEINKNIRNFLDKEGFLEIETPILVETASGAQAKPFITQHNKLQREFFLRIATEIPLKKLLVGGFEKVYEIGRIFRNEGIDARHNPEFTTVEIYQAYEDANYMMDLTEKVFLHLSNEVFKKRIFEFNSQKINLSEKFAKASMLEAIEKKCNINLKNYQKIDELLELAEEKGLKIDDFQKSKGGIIMAFFEKFVEKELIQPTFIYDFPIEASPLAKAKQTNKEFADRFELYIAGLEFANGYSELNDPFEQKKRFEQQVFEKELGNEEITEFDSEFIKALEYGMPPAGGLGIGIDRLVMLFAEQNSIKEVIAFPQLKEAK